MWDFVFAALHVRPWQLHALSFELQPDMGTHVHFLIQCRGVSPQTRMVVQGMTQKQQRVGLCGTETPKCCPSAAAKQGMVQAEVPRRLIFNDASHGLLDGGHGRGAPQCCKAWKSLTVATLNHRDIRRHSVRRGSSYRLLYQLPQDCKVCGLTAATSLLTSCMHCMYLPRLEHVFSRACERQKSLGLY